MKGGNGNVSGTPEYAISLHQLVKGRKNSVCLFPRPSTMVAFSPLCLTQSLIDHKVAWEASVPSVKISKAWLSRSARYEIATKPVPTAGPGCPAYQLICPGQSSKLSRTVGDGRVLSKERGGSTKRWNNVPEERCGRGQNLNPGFTLCR